MTSEQPEQPRSIVDRWASDERAERFLTVTRPSDAQLAAERVPDAFLEDTGGKRQ